MGLNKGRDVEMFENKFNSAKNIKHNNSDTINEGF